MQRVGAYSNRSTSPTSLGGMALKLGYQNHQDIHNSPALLYSGLELDIPSHQQAKGVTPEKCQNIDRQQSFENPPDQHQSMQLELTKNKSIDKEEQ